MAKEKIARTVTAKKLPRLFKKSYTEKNLDKKLYKKIYIDSDKALLKSLFKPDPKSEGKKVKKFKIPSDTVITLKDCKRLKVVAKEIKKQKGRFKTVPFAAVVVVIVAIGVTVTLFKNPIAKKLIESSMEKIFVAKCDVTKVDIQIFGAKVEVDGIYQANRSSPMTNLFEIGKVDLDFNLAQLLRGRFDAQNIEVSGVAIGTARKTSGALPPKKVEKIEAARKKDAEKVDEAGFFDSLKEKSGNAAQASLSGLFEQINQYNPEAVIKEVQSKIQTPAVAKEVESKVNSLVDQYKNKPAELEKTVTDFQKSAEQLAKLDVSKLKTPAEIQNMITQINGAIENGKKAKETVESTVSGIKNDTEEVTALTKKMNDAIKADTALINEKAGMYINFSMDDATRMVTGAMDQYLYSMLGKYYPYLQKAINAAGSSKGSDKKSEKNAKKAKAAKRQGRRLYGRDIYWKKDNIPSFLVEKAFASGPNFEAKALEISNDMDKRGKPASGNGKFNIGKTNHGLNFVVDGRSYSKEPLISGNYTGSGIPLKMDMTFGAEGTQGVPTFDGPSKISAKITADENFAFTIDGNLLMSPVKITATPFDNKKINSLYQTALSSISSLNVGAVIKFDQEKGLSLSLKSDADKLVGQALKATLESELKNLTAGATEKLKEELSKNSSGAMKSLSQFADISALISNKENAVDAMNKQIEAKKKELENKAKEAASNAAKDAIKSAIPGASDSGASKAVNGLMKGFGF